MAGSVLLKSNGALGALLRTGIGHEHATLPQTAHSGGEIA
jgi:hypothetical protein